MSAKHEQYPSPADAGDLSRRDFVAVSVATGVVLFEALRQRGAKR